MFNRSRPLKRIVFEVYAEDVDYLHRHIPSGMRSEVFRRLTQYLCNDIHKNGTLLTYSIASGKFTIQREEPTNVTEQH